MATPHINEDDDDYVDVDGDDGVDDILSSLVE